MNKKYNKLINLKIQEMQENLRILMKKVRYQFKYGDNYKEVIQIKWDMRKLSRKFPEKGLKIKGVNKI